MHHMHDLHHMHHHAASLDWFTSALALAFALAAGFYLVRLMSRTTLMRVNGYFDAENEVWHMLCLIGMTACLVPSLIPLPALAFQGIFLLGTGWYTARALTWGKKLAHNKQWYDWAHAGMLLGMWWMFAQPGFGLAGILVNTAFWTWFSGYYVYQTGVDWRSHRNVWSLGQDIAHLSMGVVMILMTVYPSIFGG